MMETGRPRIVDVPCVVGPRLTRGQRAFVLAMAELRLAQLEPHTGGVVPRPESMTMTIELPEGLAAGSLFITVTVGPEGRHPYALKTLRTGTAR